MQIPVAAAQQIDALQEHEKAISRLYAAYARRFPQDRDFWLNLSQEEVVRAGWIESLQAKVEQDPSGLIVNRFPTVTIGHSITYINRLIDAVDQPSLTPIRAFSAALDVERALLENRYFEVFEGDGPELHRTLTMLSQSTRSHIDRVHQAWRNKHPSAPCPLPS